MDDRAKLLLNVDDFGMASPINEAADRLLGVHPAVGLSIMPTGSAFGEAVTIARNHGQDLGVHLTLVEDKPLSSKVNSKDSTPGLNPPPQNYKQFIARYLRGSIRREDIKQEIELQIKRVLSAGLTVSHIDSHQHLHLLPGLFNIVLEMARKHNIPYVRTANVPLLSGVFRRRTLPILGAKVASWFSRRSLRSTPIRTNDYFLGLHHSQPLNRSIARTLIQGIARKGGMVEWGIHVATGALEDSSRFRSERRLEANLEIFTSEWFQKILSENRVSLIEH